MRFISIEAPFIDELSGMVIVKLLDLKMGGVNKIKVKVIRNVGFLDVTNNSSEQLIFNRSESLGVSIGYYKVIQSNIQHYLDVVL